MGHFCGVKGFAFGASGQDEELAEDKEHLISDHLSNSWHLHTQYVAQSKTIERGSMDTTPNNIIWDFESKFNLKLLEEYCKKLENFESVNSPMSKDQRVSWTLKWLINKVKLRRMDEET